MRQSPNIALSSISSRLASLSPARKSGLIIGFLLAVYALACVLTPNGGYDAWLMWTVKARFLYYDPALAFRYPGVVHPDYPPLIPALVALGYALTGSTSVGVPAVVHGIIFLSLLMFFRPRPWALLLIGMIMVSFAAQQIADAPLALALLAAVVAFRYRRDARAGIALSAGALIKNEGLLIAFCFVVVIGLTDHRRLPRLILGLLPGLLSLAAFKLWVGAPNDIFSSSGLLQRLLDPARYAALAPRALIGLITFSTGGLPVFVVCARLMNRRFILSAPMLALALCFVGYLTVYLITPLDLIWQFNTSYERLLAQLFPAFAYLIVFDDAFPPLALRRRNMVAPPSRV